MSRSVGRSVGRWVGRCRSVGRSVGDGVACRSGKGAEKHRAVDIDRWAMMGREPGGRAGAAPQ